MFFINSPKFGPVHTEPHSSPTSFPLPPPLCPFFLLSSKRKKEVTLTQEKKQQQKKRKKKRKTYFQTGCLRSQHRSPATIKTFALPDRVLSIGLSTLQNESQVPVKMSSWAAFAAGLKKQRFGLFLHSEVFTTFHSFAFQIFKEAQLHFDQNTLFLSLREEVIRTNLPACRNLHFCCFFFSSHVTANLLPQLLCSTFLTSSIDVTTGFCDHTRRFKAFICTVCGWESAVRRTSHCKHTVYVK